MRRFNSTLKRFIPVSLILALLLVINFAPVSAEKPDTDHSTINKWMRHPKLKAPEEILNNFIEGHETTSVIVVMKEVPRPVDMNLRKKQVRLEINREVSAMQDRVIDGISQSDMEITNRFKYIEGFSARVNMDGMQALLNHPLVESVEENRILHAHTNQGIPLMNGTTVRNTYNGSGLAIAICDTGIDYMHPRLGGAALGSNTKVIGGYDCGDNDTNPMDAAGHGTACAGIAAGDLGTSGDYIGGVAYSAKLYAVKISTGTGGSASTANMIEGWEWCITHQDDDPNNPIMVISTSFGGGKYSSTCNTTSTAMTTAASNANAAGITIFVSSGNDGYCDSMGWPACITHVVSVGAVYDAAVGTSYWCVSGDSCATPLTYTATGCLGAGTTWYTEDTAATDAVTKYSNTASFLTLFAPSNNAYTTDISGSGGYSSGDFTSDFGGTSAACPYAAGAAACLQSAAMDKTGNFLSPADVESYLVDNGDSITDGKVNITKPRINLGDAINALPTEQDTTPPVISNVASGNITDSTADITWTTDEAATSVVHYGLTAAYGSTESVSGYSTSHLVGLSGLSANTTYHYKVVSVDSSNNSAESGDYTFTTTDTPVSPEMYVLNIVQSIAKKGKNYESSATITVRDTDNQSVSGASVTITWSGVVSGTYSATTGSGGTVTFKSSKVKSTGPFTITVNNITHASLTYNPALNVETTDTANY